MARHSEFTKDVDLKTGLLIKNYRIERGWSRQQLAAKIGVTHQQLQKYEKGTNRVTLSRFLQLSEAFEVSPVALIGNIYKVKTKELGSARIGLENAREFLKINSSDVQSALTQLTRAIAAEGV
jgi:transcriptional regulator with XRE-family HTH domain